MHVCKISNAITIFLCAVIVLNAGLFFAAHSVPFSVREKANKNEPYLFHHESILWGGLSDFAVCGDYMYVLFESKKVLNCYSLDGQYLHSYSFDMRKNGQSHLYVKGGHLYLESREHFFYRFKNGIFVDVHVPASSQIYTLRAKLAAGSHSHRITNGEYMELRGASIWRTGESVHEEIIHRPLWLLIFQGNIQIYIFLLCMLSIVFLNFRYVKHFCSISPFA